MSLSVSIAYNVPRFFEFQTSFNEEYDDCAANATDDKTQSSQLRNVTMVTFCTILIYIPIYNNNNNNNNDNNFKWW